MQITQEHRDFIDLQFQGLVTYNALRPANHLSAFQDHSERVAKNMKELGQKMGYDNTIVEALYLATLIHDIGKTRLPVEIWDYDETDQHGNNLKPPEDLKAQRRKHTTLGVEIVKETFPETWNTAPFLRLVCDLMQYHHDYLDGSGYLGKAAKDLSQEVQMLVICDSYDGWTIPHPHKTAEQLTPRYIIDQKMNDGRFNQDILKQFREIILCQLKTSSLSHSSC